ncbi:glycosyltransferase family 87 protein [Paraburkholderia sp. J67]|uniref:glycosyltransferase family 87 protein n=1 Tax=Paraburkholderia sp. J67 TaxID=2805435 RepID=UPI002ABD3050|nr:glycosyltransferase family 87 protein [Paraburkholderia sp. J67]
MDIPVRSARSAEVRVHGWLTNDRFVAYSFLMCVLYVCFLWTWGRVTHGFTTTSSALPAGDFAVFWSASHVMLHGTAAQVYDFTTFSAAEKALFSSFSKSTFLPWLYPPTFLVLVTPLALFPFLLSFALFIGTSLLAYVKATLATSGLARWSGNARVAVVLLTCSPCVFGAALFGQNSLLTAALAGFAVRWIDRHPLRAGLCIGLLCIKPQMALVFPFVLLATGAWRVLATAAATAITLTGLSVAICGMHTVKLFFLATDLARSVILEHGPMFWFASPTPFAALRLSEVPLPLAYLLQGTIAALTIAAACHVWRHTRDAGARAAILALATLISNPYVWFYELTWLGLALAWLIATGLRTGWLRGEQTIVVLAWLLPLYELVNRYAKLPQIGPVVLLLALLLVLRRTREAKTSRATLSTPLHEPALAPALFVADPDAWRNL